ncbi:sensor histidine kinase [Streptomyces indicus]|uniref:histidine kinase n=1 Tax=Streptomyces indicus TaxID=417292 RepID=A0A1G9FF33_9ACTN|nr:histidine kinase [Streptomyces indicus]SDK86979.1 Signal transduction histidine kinase [Streptomyces indicus]
MTARTLARALLGRRARLRWVHLVLGGALLMPFWLVAALVVLPVAGGGNAFLGSSVAAQFGAYAVALPLAWVAGLFPLVRPLSVGMARALCGVDGARFADGPARGGAARRRTAGWFTLHVGVGGILSGMLLALPPFAVSVMLLPFAPGLRDWLRLPASLDTAWALALAPFAGLAMLLLLALCATAAGALLARCAPVLLGPTPADRLAAAEQRAAELAVRNRLARELHDSVGHALSAVSLQASAARRVLDSDPAFVREALAAIEDTTRRTVGELDAVLGLLREGDTAAKAPAPTLADDLPGLLDRTRATGTAVTAQTGVDAAALPVLVSREAYRIVQEGLGNALRHAPGSPVDLRIAVSGDEVEIVLENPLSPGSPAASEGSGPGARPGSLTGSPAGSRSGGGHGLAGIADRARLLGGSASAGPCGGPGEAGWRLAVRLPLTPSGGGTR